MVRTFTCSAFLGLLLLLVCLATPSSATSCYFYSKGNLTLAELNALNIPMVATQADPPGNPYTVCYSLTARGSTPSSAYIVLFQGLDSRYANNTDDCNRYLAATSSFPSVTYSCCTAARCNNYALTIPSPPAPPLPPSPPFNGALGSSIAPLALLLAAAVSALSILLI